MIFKVLLSKSTASSARSSYCYCLSSIILRLNLHEFESFDSNDIFRWTSLAAKTLIRVNRIEPWETPESSARWNLIQNHGAWQSTPPHLFHQRRLWEKYQEIKEVFFCFVIRLLYIAINVSYTSHNKAFQQSALHIGRVPGAVYIPLQVTYIVFVCFLFFLAVMHWSV